MKKKSRKDETEEKTRKIDRKRRSIRKRGSDKNVNKKREKVISEREKKRIVSSVLFSILYIFLLFD